MDDPDALAGFDFDPRNQTFHSYSRMSWPIQHQHQHQQQHPHPHQHQHQHHHHHQHHESLSPPMQQMTYKRSTSPLPLSSAGHAYSQSPSPHHPPATGLMDEWQLTSQGSSTAFTLDTNVFPQTPFETYGGSFNTSPTDYMAPNPSLNPSYDGSLDANLGAGLHLDSSYLAMPDNGLTLQEYASPMAINWHGLDMNDLMAFPSAAGLPDLNATQQQQPHAFPAASPSSTYISDHHLEVRSLSSSDNGWATIDQMRGAIFNPEQTLHPRTLSDSSYSDVEYHSRRSLDGFVEVPNAIHSPGTESAGDLDFYSDHGLYYDTERTSPPAVITTATIQPIAIRQPRSHQQPSPTSPASRKPARKGPTPAKASKTVARRPTAAAKPETEKRVGRRKGPLRPDQRKQACEIRKLGACLRCKFLKKTCDKGEPCGGCQPSHARLWQVPCTRIDIKDIGYFMKDYKADFERHVSLGISVGNIKGFSDKERTIWITHGYGHQLPVHAREIYVRDDRCFGMNWVETGQGFPAEHDVNTAKLSAGMEGISTALLSDYLDRHIDGGFEDFVTEYFEGTPFITQILKTAYRYWLREKIPVIRKALKLVLAYNLTQHVTLVNGIGDEEGFLGKIEEETSKYRGQIIAPVMINFQVKCAMADMWRELQKDILEELSALYSSVYGKDKLKHWPTIFILASILLAVWEEMQFDCHYRVPNPAVVEKFCHDMETTPVGVIVGLFQAISQKLPSFAEWDTQKHHHLLNSNQAVCQTMEEVRDHVTRFDSYLRGRSQATFDRNDFDSLSNKFTAKLVIRAN